MGIYSYSTFGYEGSLVSIEVDLRRGIPAVDVIGLSDCAVKESRERMQAAIRNSGFEFPAERVLIALSPADIKKEGAGFDLPIALGVLSAKEDYPKSGKNVLVMGELELSGVIRPVKGVYPALSTAASCGIKYAIVPEGSEKAVPKGIKVFYINKLEDAERTLRAIYKGEKLMDFAEPNWNSESTIEFPELEMMSLDDINGHDCLKFAMAVAVAGRHNMLVWGSPGCGKTLCLQSMPEITPNLTSKESQSTTRIWSLAGLMRGKDEYLKVRPFRMPHQTASLEGICGGGPNCRPGEISLAHNGTLFLDEAAEFRSSVLQMLRCPIENGSITLSRAGRSTVFPARFQLVMATNPCPCGNYGSPKKICLCSAKSVDLYWKKFSAPLLDRVAIRFDAENGEDSVTNVKVYELKNMIKTAFDMQLKRGEFNEYLSPKDMEDFIVLDEESQAYLDETITRRGLSPRGIKNILRVSRTLADMGGKEKIVLDDVKRAVKLFGEITQFPA